MQRYSFVLLMGGALLLNGCHFGYYPKRQSELNCPTDIRQTVPWCAGEDAVFRCPCGPSPQFYGHKPTCWGTWPASGAQWRDSYCGCPLEYATDEELTAPIPVTETLPESAHKSMKLGPQRVNSLPPIEAAEEPLFVPPAVSSTLFLENMKQKAAMNQSSSTRRVVRSDANRSAERAHREQYAVQQVTYVEEITLEPHSWTGITFIR